MIFTSLGLLLVAAGMLIAGIAKSSVALLMTSLLLTIGSGVVLIMALATARRLAGVSGVSNGSTPMMTPQGQPVVLYLQQAPPPARGTTTMPAIDLSSAGESTPFIGYDLLTAKQVTELIDSGALSTEQLAAVREYESAHSSRRTVLSRLDKMLASA
jgi:hypothetical protein